MKRRPTGEPILKHFSAGWSTVRPNAVKVVQTPPRVERPLYNEMRDIRGLLITAIRQSSCS